MKTCSCVRYFAIYPCGHKLTTWEYCSKAKAKGLLKRGPPTPCLTHTSEEILPDLEDTCGSTCLTMPFQCTRCGAAKQVGWRCSRCQYLRGPQTQVWSTCTCPKHNCLELALGKRGEGLCKPCQSGVCVRAPGAKSQAKSIGTPVLHWKCHKCSRMRCTPANSMKCSSPGVEGCDHTRCGDCRALFRCSCKCGCLFNFVEGGPKPCDWCIKSCSA
ncbi:hypothetical protein F5Y06DRAFT_22103 [Hypoxylon sp. FL0890]|nr:hypothetical protein F5Y06DRAFT_22103 [Hypoxylon sp. FL0890]